MSADVELPLIVLRFEGPTFVGGDLPANALRELALFQEVFVDVAADVWRARHPDQWQLPEGFAAAVEPRVRALRAGGVEIGCAASANGGAAAVEARDLLLDALYEGACGRVHPGLSAQTIERLSTLGATLGVEDLLVAQQGEQRSVRLDEDARMAFRDAAAATRDAGLGTFRDLIELADRTFGQVPDEVWAELPVLGPEDIDDYIGNRP